MAAYDSPFEAALARAQRLNLRLEKKHASMKLLASQNRFAEAYETGFEAADLAEKLVLLDRALPCYTGHPNARSAMETAILDAVPLEMGYTAEGWFCLRMPLLLPKKELGSTAYIRGLLYPAMKRFFQNTAPIRFQPSVLIFRHIYDASRPNRAYRDHDNIELNAVTDTIALHLMKDDHPLLCSHYYCSAPGPVERTEVYLVPQTDFPVWLSQAPSLPPDGVKLAREPPGGD